ncbi:BamA/TamA family outer membrane protein [Chitinispirillales bacterium ANBcel5]|uniref:BamA/TamA family outer membrane protein n=1 Tax=Cellulosispirillum alkaliphilum TaxID=3039283 RepID=UPI002A5167AE|nr:BamA/TamA family outer membrane protein [Chitinispirillales bacterium ANBcel5]
MFKKALFITIFLSLSISNPTYGYDFTSIDSSNIKSVQIVGADNVCHHLIKQISGIDTSVVLTHDLIEKGKQHLLQSVLFSEVQVFYTKEQNGADVFIKIEEGPRFSISDIGGMLYSYKYGERDPWWRLQFGITDHNFRNKMERLSLTASIWEWRSLALLWVKPLIGTPYYIGLGSSFASYPYDIWAYDYRDIVARAQIGRNLNHQTRVAFNIIPTFRRRIGRASSSDTSVVEEGVKDFYEAFATLSLIKDHRSRRFDPESGFYNRTQLMTNYLYHGANTPFWQLSNDFRFYLTSFLESHKFAFRLNTTVRNRNAGNYHRRMYGGSGQVRGYTTKELGANFVVNNSILFSSEYRFPIWTAPDMPFPLVSILYPGVRTLSWRIDGALIYDYARIGSKLSDLIVAGSETETGHGVGAALRIMFPNIRNTICFDVVFGRRKRDPKTNPSFTWPPVLYLYLDMHF